MKVVGTIGATPTVVASARYKGSSSRIRSNGIYAELTHDKQVRIDAWTSGYQHCRERANRDMPLVIAALEAKGLKVVERETKTWLGAGTELIVVVAETN
jgi:hypothetical protein